MHIFDAEGVDEESSLDRQLPLHLALEDGELATEIIGAVATLGEECIGRAHKGGEVVSEEAVRHLIERVMVPSRPAVDLIQDLFVKRGSRILPRRPIQPALKIQVE